MIFVDDNVGRQTALVGIVRVIAICLIAIGASISLILPIPSSPAIMPA